MARGALDISGCDIAIATTGVIGPDPDEDGNPVGTVHVAVAQKDGNFGHYLCELPEEPPEEVCKKAVEHALELTLKIMRA